MQMLSLQLCQKHNFAEFTLDVSKILTKVYESEGKKDSTIKYMHIMINANDSVFSQSKGRQFQQIVFKEIQRQQEINTAKERYQNQVRDICTAGCIGYVFIDGLYFLSQYQAKTKS